MDKEDRVRKAIDQGLKYLKYGDRTVHELKEKLRGKGYSGEAVEKAIRRLKELGFLNDGEYVERWIRGKLKSRPIGRRTITQKLRLKGVHPEVVEERLEPLYREFSDDGGIETLARKQARKYGKYEERELKSKLFGFLVRRGFDYDECTRAVEDAIRDMKDDEEE